VILKSETYNFHRLDLTRQADFIVTIYDEDGLQLAATTPAPTLGTAARRRKLLLGLNNRWPTHASTLFAANNSIAKFFPDCFLIHCCLPVISAG
jgi:hypothetical protein